jgi:formiminoglutamate deiminase
MTSLWFDTALLADGWARGVRLAGAGAILETIERGVAALPGDERGTIAVPGAANVHSHAFQRALLAETRGGADDFWTWREAMYGLVARLAPEDVEAIAAQAYAEMLESGFTRVGEFHYLHHQASGAPYADPAEMAGRLVAAAQSSGVGLTLLPVLYAHGGFGGAPPGPAQRRFVNDADSYARLLEASRAAARALPGALVGAAAHSLRAVTPEQLAAVVELAGAGPIHIHVAEQTREVEACLAWSGQPPVAWLLGHAEIDDRWCLVHATHMEADEIAAAAASGAVAGLCPLTEANLGDGLFPAAAFLSAGGAFGVGSDANTLVDLPGELRLLEYGQRLTARTRAVIASPERPSVGASLFAGAVAGGARALGVSGYGLAAGAPFDVVSLDGDHPSLAGRNGDALLDAWIFAARGGCVDKVWCGGVLRVTGGRHLGREAIAAAYRSVLARLQGG